MNSVKVAVNDILCGWKHLWPGGLSGSGDSTLNLMAHFRQNQPISPDCKPCRHDHVLCRTRRSFVESFENAQSIAIKGLRSFSLVTAPDTG